MTIPNNFFTRFCESFLIILLMIGLLIGVVVMVAIMFTFFPWWGWLLGVAALLAAVDAID